MRAGDDLIGPRDIKRGVHLLTNAEMAILNVEEEEEETGMADEEAPESSDAPAKPKKKHNDSAIVRGDKLSEDQLTQVLAFLKLLKPIGPHGPDQAGLWLSPPITTDNVMQECGAMTGKDFVHAGV